jgi:hypothetical protein
MNEDFDVFEEDTKQKESDEKRKRRRSRELSDIKKVLSLPEGRRFIWRIWGLTGCFKASFTPKDTNMTCFREGQRDIGMALLEDVNLASPMAYAQMKTEFMSETAKEKKEITNA